MPRIVVGIGVFNEAQYLDETIPAILNQTMPDFQLFILDNGSTDGSTEILQRFAASDDRVMLVRVPVNLPPPIACNFGVGLQMTHWQGCRWFMANGADDVMEPDYLEAILAAAAANPRVNLIFSPMRFIGHPERGTWTYPPYNPKRVHEQLMVPGWRAFTRELWEAVGPENTFVGPGSDWEWVTRASKLGVLLPHQLERSYLSLRVREGGRVAQSNSGHWPSLSSHMADIMAAPSPVWARSGERPRAPNVVRRAR